MKFTYLTSFPADTALEVTYTVETGDPVEFFFEVRLVDNGMRFDVSGRQSFSGSGRFNTTPGDQGLHSIEAYNVSAVVGETPPFAVGPTYTVLPPSSIVSIAPPITEPSQPTTLPPTVSTHTVPTPSTPAPPPTQNPSSTQDVTRAPSSSPTLTPGSVPIANKSLSPAQPSTEIWHDSVVGSTSTVTAPSSSSSSIISSSNGKASSPNIQIIIGAAVGGAVALGIVLIFLLFCLWRRHQRSRPASILISNAPPTIDPFFAFSGPVSPSEKSRARFQDSSGSSDSTRTSISQSVSRSNVTGLSSDSNAGGTPTMVGPQMEWVLRATNDPPPGYNLSA
ncbi:hypothetical protein FB451DRAFT_66605 [Mycena latifolia]|nr:hypothetical protein FB451DRAFT_66605 [Mycena latifolia]